MRNLIVGVIASLIAAAIWTGASRMGWPDLPLPHDVVGRVLGAFLTIGAVFIAYRAIGPFRWWWLTRTNPVTHHQSGAQYMLFGYGQWSLSIALAGAVWGSILEGVARWLSGDLQFPRDLDYPLHAFTPLWLGGSFLMAGQIRLLRDLGEQTGVSNQGVAILTSHSWLGTEAVRVIATLTTVVLGTLLALLVFPAIYSRVVP